MKIQTLHQDVNVPSPIKIKPGKIINLQKFLDVNHVGLDEIVTRLTFIQHALNAHEKEICSTIGKGPAGIPEFLVGSDLQELREDINLPVSGFEIIKYYVMLLFVPKWKTYYIYKAVVP